MSFLYTLILLTAAVGIAAALCHGPMREAVRSALGILLVSAMLSPFLSLLSSLDGLSSSSLGIGSYVEKDAFCEITSVAFEEGVRAAIADAFSVGEGVEVRVRGFSPSELRADGVTVILPQGAAGVDFRAVRDYVEQNFTRVGGCEVIYG